jgi:DNA-binding GntR family transcriptional regulator
MSITKSKRLTRDGDAGARIAERIRGGILEGEYPPGTRIRQEDVAERFGASRVPVREALRILEHEGLVTLVANTGAWVAELTLAQCEEIYQMRERLEPLLLRFSAPGLTREDLDHRARRAPSHRLGPPRR